MKVCEPPDATEADVGEIVPFAPAEAVNAYDVPPPPPTTPVYPYGPMSHALVADQTLPSLS